MRKLLKSKSRTIKSGVSKKYYHLYFSSYCDCSHKLVPFTGVIGNDRDKLSEAVNKAFPSHCGLYGTSYSIARVFQFKNSGVVVLNTSMYIGD
jgi:hypothetical protein